jgi:hypothetical protein
MRQSETIPNVPKDRLCEVVNSFVEDGATTVLAVRNKDTWAVGETWEVTATYD